MHTVSIRVQSNISHIIPCPFLIHFLVLLPPCRDHITSCYLTTPVAEFLVILCTLYMYLIWAEADLRPRPSPVQFYSRLCITKQMAECYRPEESSPSIFVRYKLEGQREELRSAQSVQYLNNISLGQKLSSTSGQPEFVATEILSNSSIWLLNTDKCVDIFSIYSLHRLLLLTLL